jgi:hypothetical protein
MTINGSYHQDAGSALIIAVTGTNTVPNLQYDRLVVSGRADLGGVIAYGFFNPADAQSTNNVFYPQEGATIDVVLASKIAAQNLLVRGPIWGDGLHFRWDIVDVANGRQALRLTAGRIPPVIAIQQRGDQVQIAYPTNYTGYTLEKATTLAPGNWTPTGTTGNSATIPASGGAAFFRLKK